MSDKFERTLTAFHDAGHLVIGNMYDESEYAEILDDKNNCGQTKYKHNLEDIEKEACVLILLAGPLSELKYREKTEKNISIKDTGSNDIYRAKQVLGWNHFLESDEEYIKQLEPYTNRAEAIVSGSWEIIKTVAGQLIKKNRVNSTELDNMI